MNLVIDIGNTAVKIAVFENEKIIFKESFVHTFFAKHIHEIQKKYSTITKAILSSVGNISDSDVKMLQEKYDVTIVDAATKMPFRNLYSTPHTLGVDRLALVAAAVAQYKAKNVLVIDAGTCITYDFKNSNEEYLGGAIAPGVQLRYESLHTYTSKLPLLAKEYPQEYIGNSTNQSIHVGVVRGVLHEIEGVIAQYCNTYDDLTVILTGGDAHFLSKRLKNSIFATSNFLLEGLNYILAYNNSQ